MAVRAEQRKVFNPIIAPITVDMFDFDWNLIGLWMPLGPTATGAAFTQSADQVLTQERGRLKREIFAGLENCGSETKCKLLLAAKGTELRRAYLYRVSTSSITVSTKLLGIHASTVPASSATCMAFQMLRRDVR